MKLSRPTKLSVVLLSVAALVLTVTLIEPSISDAAGKRITDRCKRRLVRGYLYKESSDGSGAPREGKPAVIFERNKPAKDNIRVYAKNGTQICSFKRWTLEEKKYGRRYYSGTGCGKSASALASAARKASGSSTIYIEGPSDSCLGPIEPGKRKDTR